MKWCFSILFLFIGVLVWAQDIQFQAQAPQRVGVGQRFRVIYSVNAEGTNFKPGTFEGFRVLSGPNPSQSSSVQIVNGKVSQNIQISYSFILEAQKEGQFSIPPATITVDGKAYTCDSKNIDVIKGQANSQAQRSNPNAPATGNRNASGSVSIKADDIYLRQVVSKRNVLRGEPIVATLKLYTKVNLADVGNFKAPTFNGFWSETLKDIKNIEFQREEVNGQVYNTAILQQQVLIPERTGELLIDPAEMTALIQVRVRNQRSRSMFDQFFGTFQNIEKSLKSPTVKVTVNELPGNTPPGYSGAVGDIKLAATLEPTATKTNEPVTLRLDYSGTGNLKFIDQPKINFPPDFEVYDPKISNSFSASSKGFSGRKTFEYLVIPRHAGDFEIPQMTFSVFDINAKAYKTMTAGPFQVHVEKGEGSDEMVSMDLRNLKEDVQTLGTDIRYLKTNHFNLRNQHTPFFGSLPYYFSYLGSLGIFLLAMFFARQQRQRNADVVYVKHKKAGKVAQSRLRQAKTQLDQQKTDTFYKEILSAQWGYISDKLNIPQGELNKEKVRAGLAQHQVKESLINDYITLMDDCEFAQFAPGQNSEALSGVYQKAKTLIEQMEGAFK